MKRWILYIVYFVISFVALYSQEIIRFGNEINTEEDEFLPQLCGNSLIFGRTYKLETIPISQYSIKKIDDFKIEKSNQIKDLTVLFEPIQISDNIGTVNFRFNMVRKKIQIVRKSIFYNERILYDFHPAISPDSLYIVFVSDRFEKNSGNVESTTDLYITFKLADGQWSEPYNLGPEINSENNEITPFIDKEHNLYFSRKIMKNNRWNYDVFVAKPIGKGKWSRPVELKYPINTEFNETGFWVSGDTILFASDRELNKNRNYDIYFYINKKSSKITIDYKEQRNSAIKIDFFNYEVPFFVTGYYYPNTAKNLKDLRLRFKNGEFNNNPQLKYIKNPDLEALDYDGASIIVEEAIERACSKIISQLENINFESCPVFLTFTGYSDSRRIVDNQIYDDENIRSLNPYLFVEKGEKMDNLLLSKLRAYYTAIEVKNRLMKYPIFDKLKDKIIFIIKGNGSNNDEEVPDYMQRRVEITLKIDTTKNIKIRNLPSLEEQGLGMKSE